MATFHKRTSGKWQAKVRRAGYPTQSRTFALKGHAEAWARATERKMDRGEFIELEAAARKLTLADALTRYEQEITPTKRGAAQERVRIAAWKSHALAGRAIATIRGHEIAAYRNERLEAGLSPNTVRLELAVLSHLYSVARAEWGFESLANPVRAIEKPAVAARARRRRLEGDEEQRLLEAAPRVASWLAPAIRLAIETAMRRGELASLEWSEVDVHRNVAHLSLTKNGDARDVPLSDAAVTALRELAGGDNWPKSGRVLSAGPDRLSHAFIKVCELAGIVDLTLHDLRHEATSRLFELGRLGLPEVAAITGHKTWSMLRRYTHPRAADLARKLRGA